MQSFIDRRRSILSIQKRQSLASQILGIGAKSITTPNSPRESQASCKQVKRSDKSNGSYMEGSGIEELKLENFNVGLNDLHQETP